MLFFTNGLPYFCKKKLELETLISKTVTTLEGDGIIVFPTDTVWGIGGDARNADVVSKIYTLKNRVQSKALLCLMQDIDMVVDYFGRVPEKAITYFNDQRPTTVILDDPKGIAKNMIASDNSLAVRIPKDPFCQSLIKTYGHPIIATSANTSGQPTPQQYSEIESSVLAGVDYVVPLKREQLMQKPSRIVKVTTEGICTVIRA